MPLQFLLTNDDGVDAAGLAALREAVATLGHPLVVAPDRCHSGRGHQVTTHEPIHITQRSGDCWLTDGTPADCVRVALTQVVPDVDWVLAGINHGGNLGADLYMSGTAAAVREGVFHGKRGIAVSHYHRKGIDPLDWSRAARWLTPILNDLISRPCEPGTFWNINLPHLPADSSAPEVVECPLDPSPLPVSYQQHGAGLIYNANYHSRPRRPGTDVDVCFSGRISVSRVPIF